MHYGPETFAMRMPDASMRPRFADGDYLFVDPDEPAEPGRFVAVEDPETGERTVRLMQARDGRRVLRPLDGEYRPEIALDRDNETMILGTVVFGGRRP